jgi:hypothetical protein
LDKGGISKEHKRSAQKAKRYRHQQRRHKRRYTSSCTCTNERTDDPPKGCSRKRTEKKGHKKRKYKVIRVEAILNNWLW